MKTLWRVHATEGDGDDWVQGVWARNVEEAELKFWASLIGEEPERGVEVTRVEHARDHRGHVIRRNP